jgi:hypothetical protein
MKLVLLVFTLIALLASARQRRNTPEKYLGILEQYFSSPRSIDIHEMTDILSSLSPASINTKVSGKSIVHQLLNLYWTIPDEFLQKKIVDWLLLMLNRGADASLNVSGEPDALTKSLLIRELQLATAVVNSSVSIVVDAPKLKELYMLSCNPTPLTKMLLHAHSILHSKLPADKRKNSSNEELLQDLIAGATLRDQSKTVRNQDLSALSKTHKIMIAQLAATGEGSQSASETASVSLTEVMSSLGEVASAVHVQLLEHTSTNPLTVSNALVYHCLTS